MPKKTASTKTNSSVIWTVILCLAIGGVAGFLLARARYKPQLNTTHDMVLEKVQEINALNKRMNRVMMVNGTMMKMTDGNVTVLDEDATLTDDTRITKTGEIIKSDGTKTMMKNGQSVGMDGMMINVQK